MSNKKTVKADICDYDEAYTKSEAEDIGWCGTCTIKECYKNKKSI